MRIESLGGATQTERLSPTNTTFVVQAAPGAWEVAATYLRLGIEHILFGFDHLLFVLALVILVRDWRRVALTVTAFTIAHSITLAAATLDLVNVPGPPVEAAIALSIVLVAVEIVNARRGTPSLTARWPWLVAFCFGLLHGFGFAGALAEVGLPHHAIPIALLFFNLGVEIGQLVFVAAVLTAGGLFRRAMALRLEPALVQRTVNRTRRDRGLRDRRSGSLLADREDVGVLRLSADGRCGRAIPCYASRPMIKMSGRIACVLTR